MRHLSLRGQDIQCEEVRVEALATFEPTIFLYDNYPGGIGFSPRLFDAHEELLRRVENSLKVY